MTFMNIVIIPSVQFHARSMLDVCTHILLEASLLCLVCENGNAKKMGFVSCHVKVSEFLCVSYIIM
jgi:hypothetical protein